MWGSGVEKGKGRCGKSVRAVAILAPKKWGANID